MTTHLTQGGDPLASGDEEEPELVFIDDDEFEAAHRHDDSFEEEDEYASGDEAELEFSFEEDLDEAIALDVSDEMDPTVEEADERMAPLFTSQRELRDASSEEALTDEGDDDAMGAATAATALAAPVLSKQEARAEEKRQREALKRRKEIDKAASQDEKERQRDEKAQAAAAEREALAAQKEAAEAEKREAADAKKQAAEDEKQAAAESKVRQAEMKVEQKAEAQRAKAEQKVEAQHAKAEQKAKAQLAKAEAKQSRAEAKRKAKRREDPIVPAGLTRFVVDEAPEPWAATTRKDARLQKQGTTRAPIVVMIVVLLAVTGIAAYAMTKSSPKAAAPGGAAHASALPAALAALVSANSADLAYAQQIGGPIPASVNGGGSVDLATQGSNLSVTYSMEGQRFPEQIVYDGGQAFYDLGAIVHFVTPSYNWVSTDLASAAPGSPGIGVGGVLADPSALVSLVQASAPTARVVGRVQLNGISTTEYAIALDHPAVTRILGSPGLPAYVHAATYTQLHEQVYVDGSGHVVRIVASGTYPESGHTVTASTTVDLSHYGTPVSVAPPPPTQVVSEQQFQASADRLAHAQTP